MGYTEYDEGVQVLEDKMVRSHEIYREQMIARGKWEENTPTIDDMFEKEDAWGEQEEGEAEEKEKNIL